MQASLSPSAAIAKQRFELENSIQELSSNDSVFQFEEEEYYDSIQHKPWTKDVSYYKHVKISAIALIKMAMHARSGGDLEVMGLMQGKVVGDTMIVMDAFALPVKGTETQVNAGSEAYVYITEYLRNSAEIGKKENAIGWYHSHPGYSCWLSGIDVSTQMSYQQFQEPWLSVVVDPKQTISSGRVELGAFRTYPEGYSPPNEGPSEYQTIPLSKIEDFGVHRKRYYPLDVTYFKSSSDTTLLDLLWNKYWNREYNSGQIMDLADKLKQAKVSQGGYTALIKEEKSKLTKATKDSNKTTMEQLHGIMSQVYKDHLFNPPTTNAMEL